MIYRAPGASRTSILSSNWKATPRPWPCCGSVKLFTFASYGMAAVVLAGLWSTL